MPAVPIHQLPGPDFWTRKPGTLDAATPLRATGLLAAGVELCAEPAGW